MGAKISQILVVIFEEMSEDKTYRIIVSGSGLFMLGSHGFIVSDVYLCLVAYMRAEHNTGCKEPMEIVYNPNH